MTVKTGASWSGLLVTLDATGAKATPSVGPAGVLYVNGVADGASVTISGSNPYKWSVTLPALSAGDSVSMYITATIATIATASIVAEDQADTKLVSNIITDTIPDSVAADGAMPTIAQALYAILQILTEKLAVGANFTIYKPDGVTPLMTFLFNDANSPTGITRLT